MGNVPSQTGAGREFDLSDPVRSFIHTTVAVVRQPARFFAHLPRSAGYVNPLIYGLVCIVISTALDFLAFEVLGLPTFGDVTALAQSPTDAGRQVIDLLRDVILFPLVLLVFAAVTHLAVRIVLGRENSGFQATFRVDAYSSALLLLEWLPYIGWLVSVYSIYVWIVGIREVHRTTTGQAIGILLLPALVIAPLYCLVVFALAMR